MTKLEQMIKDLEAKVKYYKDTLEEAELNLHALKALKEKQTN